MTTATLTSKGQITIPAEVRAALGVDAGDRVEFVEVAPGRYEFIAATRSVTALKGMFGKARKAVSIDEMNAAIARRGAAACLPEDHAAAISFLASPEAAYITGVNLMVDGGVTTTLMSIQRRVFAGK